MSRAMRFQDDEGQMCGRGGAALVAALFLVGAGDAMAGGNPFIVDGLNETQVTMADAIAAVCPPPNNVGNTADFQMRCNGVAGGTDEQKLNSLQVVAPEQTSSANTQGTRSGGGTSQASNTISTRLAAFRSGAVALLDLEFNGERVTGSSLADLAPDAITQGAAGSDAAPRLGLYLNGGYQFGEIDSTVALRGFDYDNGGLTAGADYRVTDSVLVGGAFNWWRTQARFEGDAGKTTSDLYAGSLYASWLPVGGLYMSGIVGLGGMQWDATRKIQYTTAGEAQPIDTTATGSPNGSQLTTAGTFGYEFQVDALNVGPYAQVQYRRIVVDQYREEGGDGWGMLFLGQKVESVTTALGGTVDLPISTGLGVVVTQLRGAWWHEYLDDARVIRAQFLGAEGNANKREFSVFTDDPDRNYGNVGISVSLTLPEGIAGFVDWDSLLGYEGVTSNRLTLGVRGSFF